MQTHLRRTEAAEYIRQKIGSCSTDTLAKLACVGGGPKFRKFGRYPVYKTEELDEWVASKLTGPINSTSELPTPSRKSSAVSS